MLYKALEIVKDQVSAYLETVTTTANLVVLENIAKLDDATVTTLVDKVVLTLINMEEEVTLKNKAGTYTSGDNAEYKNPPIHLNLYLLFSVNRTNYDQSLDDLASVVEFFQGKRLFNNANTVLNPANTALTDVTEFKFTVELYTPTFEQQNYIWGTLGGKSLPNAMYKLTLAKIDRDTIRGTTTRISNTQNTVLPI